MVNHKNGKLSEGVTPTIVALLADGLPVTKIAERLEAPYTTTLERCRRPEVVEAVEREVAHREAASRRMRLAHAEKVFEAASRAACGDWIPTETQLELQRYFMSWEPRQVGAEQDGEATNDNRVLIVQQFLGDGNRDAPTRD